MSGERLREAAGAIRDEWGGRGDEGTAWHRVVAFHLAVADWLEQAADHMDPALALDGGCEDCEDEALAVANAYLGSPS